MNSMASHPSHCNPLVGTYNCLTPAFSLSGLPRVAALVWVVSEYAPGILEVPWKRKRL